MFNKYPYTDFHELNLDWFLRRFKSLVTEWSEMEKDFTDLRAYVENYFRGLDVQTVIDAKLEEMLTDGGLEDLLKNITTYTFDDTNLVTYEGKSSSFGVTDQWYRHYRDLGDLSETPILQGSCYNSNTDRVIAGFCDTDHLVGKLVEMSIDMQTVYRISGTLPIGHVNGLAYIPSRNEILVAPANTGNYANRMIIIDGDTLTIKSSRPSVISTIGSIAFDDINNVIYYSNIYANQLAILDTDYNTITTVNIQHLTDIYDDVVGPAGSLCFNGTYYMLWATTRGVSYMTYYDLNTGNIKKYYEIPNNYNWAEAEGGFVANGNIYLLSSQFMLMMQELSGNITISESRVNTMHSTGKLIPGGSDLDDYVTPGKYYSPNASVTAQIDNYPPFESNYGFSLYVIPLAANHVMQILITNGQYENVCSRVCVDTVNERNINVTWRPWNGYPNKMVNGSEINMGAAFAEGATITGAGKEIYAYIPIARVVTQDFINNASISSGQITVRQNGSYLFQSLDLTDSNVVSSVTLSNVFGKLAIRINLVNAPSGVINNDIVSLFFNNLVIS